MFFIKVQWKWLILVVIIIQLTVLLWTVVYYYRPILDSIDGEASKKVPFTLKSTTYNLNYTFGERVTGDEIITKYKNSFHWTKPTNKTLDIFSSEKRKHNLTYVQIEVVQTTPFGAARVIDGGIGHKFITIRVNATNTTRMDFATQYYGIKT